MKICIVTGGSSGIGYETALMLARNNCRIILLSKDRKRGMTALQQIMKTSGSDDHFFFPVDLASQMEIKNVCDEIAYRFDIIDVLINNASCVSSDLVFTPDKVEMQMAVNHIAPFLLTHNLLPLIRKSRQGRIINVASRAHARGKIYWDDIFLIRNYNLTRMYNQSKLAGMYFTYELASRLSESGVTVNTFHPGLVNTRFGEKNTSFMHALAWKLMKRLGRSPALAARDAVYLALNPLVEKISGKYFHNKQQIASSPLSYDADATREMWNLTCNWCGIEGELYGKDQYIAEAGSA